VNKAFADMHGCRVGELIGKHISIFHSPEQMPAVEEANRKIQETGEFVGEIWHIRCDGTPFLAHMHNSLLRDEDGNPIGMIATIRDLSDRIRAEEVLRESEEKFRLAFENAKDAVLWASPKTGKILNCNRAAEIMLEKTRDEIIGQSQGSLHPPEKVDYYARMFKAHLEKKGASDDEAEVLAKSGKIVPVSITASITKVGGEEIMQGIFRDITERKKAEMQLKEYSENLERMVEKRTAELDKARVGLFHSAKLAAMGRMGAGIAHQLNSPICSGLLYLDSLAEDFENEPERAEIHEKLRRSLLSMKEAIDSTLSMAMQPRVGQPVRDRMDINDILGRVLALAEVECHKRKVEVHRRFAEGLPKIELRVGELDQVFINVINNAIDAMEEGGDLIVETSKAEGGIEVRITDTGKGIQPENMDQIFEPFFTTRMAERGLGLGLSIAREIVDRYGGEIKVESEIGRGTIFTIRLPTK
jgi:PAS domain S-box-containing protein